MGAQKSVPMGATVTGPVAAQLLAHLVSIAVLNANRDILRWVQALSCAEGNQKDCGGVKRRGINDNGGVEQRAAECRR